jgi:hypothetical protein
MIIPTLQPESYITVGKFAVNVLFVGGIAFAGVATMATIKAAVVSFSLTKWMVGCVVEDDEFQDSGESIDPVFVIGLFFKNFSNNFFGVKETWTVDGGYWNNVSDHKTPKQDQ